jgi:hypothetical protein
VPASKLKEFPRVCALVAAVPRSVSSFEEMTLDQLRTLEADLQDERKFANCLALLQGMARPRQPRRSRTGLAAAARRIGLNEP